MQKRIKIPVVILTVAAAIVIVVQLAISPIVKNYINHHGLELVGRRVVVEKLFLNLFTASIDLEGVTIYEADGEKPFLTCGEFATRLRLFPLLQKQFIISRISFDNLAARLIQQSNRFNFDDIVAHYSGDITATTTPKPSDWGIGIYNISLRNAELTYNDLSLGGHWAMDNITLDIPGFYLSGQTTNAGLQLDFPDGGSLASAIVYDHAGGTYDLTLSLRDFTISGLLPYFRQSLHISSLNGLLGGDIHIKGQTNSVLNSDLSGYTWLNRFTMIDNQERQVVAVDSITVAIEQVNLMQSRYLLNDLSIYGLVTHYELYADSTHSFNNLFPEETATAATADADAADTTAAPMTFRLDHVALRNGKVALTDHTPYTPFRYDISNIEMDATQIDLANHCSLTAKATLNNAGTARIRWTGSPSDMSYHNLTLELRNVNMSHFTPYTVSMFGYPFTQGTLAFSGQNIIRNRKLEGTNHLDIHAPKVDKKKKDLKPEYNIPLRTGLYVLTDRSGRMQMDFPVKGDIDSPEFSYKHIIIKAIVNTLVKVTVSPVKSLATAMGMSSDQMDYIEFDPSRVDFTSEQYNKMTSLNRMMQEKPELRLSLTPYFNYDKALADEALAQLKLAYYLHNNPTKAAMSLEMLEQESALAVDSRSLQLNQFADSLLAAAGKPVERDLTAKAKDLYTQTAADKLTERMQARNLLMADHLKTSLGLPDTVFSVRTMPIDSLRSYKGGNRYLVSLTLEGETN